LRIEKIVSLNSHPCIPPEKNGTLHFRIVTDESDDIGILLVPALLDPDHLPIPSACIQQVISECCVARTRGRIFEIPEDRGKDPRAVSVLLR